MGFISIGPIYELLAVVGVQVSRDQRSGDTGLAGAPGPVLGPRDPSLVPGPRNNAATATATATARLINPDIIKATVYSAMCYQPITLIHLLFVTQTWHVF